MNAARRRWSQLSIGHKVVAPFIVLTLVAGFIVSAIAAGQLASSGAQQLDTLAVREQDNVNTVFNSVEERQLADLRLLSATEGVAGAVRADDTAALSRLVLPVVANRLPERIDVAIVSATGQSVLGLEADPAHPDRCVCVPGTGQASYPHLDDVLSGRADAYGTRYEGLATVGGTRLLYTIGPIIDVNGYLAGAAVVGEPLEEILGLVEQRAQVQLSLFTLDGGALAATQRPAFPIPSLNSAERTRVLAQEGMLSKTVTAGGHEAAVFYMPWILRYQPAGYAAVVVPADPVISAQRYVLIVMIVVALGALALTLAVASIVTRSITRPMHELIRATTEVAAGNLRYRAALSSRDEIGRLATSFNLMTAILMERTDRLEKVTDEALVALAATIDARDTYTHGHSMRVAIYAHALAAACEYDDSDLEAIKRGCMVHDIGKIGVADSILRKPGPLDDKEWEAMRQHPVVGHRLVSCLTWNPIVPDVVLHHHERWDGKGYPARLAGEAIPHAARIVAIADALDAMTSRRPYRPARSFRRAANEIVSQAGVQFDARLVEIFQAHRREVEALVEGALQVWVPRLSRNRRSLRPAFEAGHAGVM